MAGRARELRTTAIVRLTCVALVGLAIALLPMRSVQADADDGTTSAQARQVRLEGTVLSSSSGIPRIPHFTLVNLSPRRRRVRLVRLSSLGSAGEERAHVVLNGTEVILGPRERRDLEPDYQGVPLMASSSGLGWRRFRLRISVDGSSLSAVAVTAYMCRIPIRLDD